MQLTLLETFGNERMIVNAARVSFNKWSDAAILNEGDQRLIKYLAAHGHWSPFAHPMLQYRIEAPIFIARQWFKHVVGISRNEVSRRYVQDAPNFYVPQVLRRRAHQAKQGSVNEPVEGNADLLTRYQSHLHEARALYERMIAAEVCPEQARMVLPQSMYSSWIETASLYATIRIIALRTDAHAQREIQELASQLAQEVRNRFPLSYQAFFSEPNHNPAHPLP